jgi:hypothetical protein
LTVVARVRATDTALSTHVDRVRVAGLPVPLILLRALTDHVVDLNAGDDLAYDLRLAPISGDGDVLRLGL